MSDTIDLILNDEDGWVAIATNPIGLNIKSNGIGRWNFAALAGDGMPDDDLKGEVYEGVSDRYVESFVGIVYVKVDTDEHPFSITSDIGATHTVQANGVPGTFTLMTTNSLQKNIIKGQLNKLSIYPRILNEHVESSREIQSIVSSGNIAGQIFKASADNISALMITLESAAGSAIDTFESYANSAALQAEWVKSGTNEAALEEIIVKTGSKAMSLPGDILADGWINTIPSTDYTDFSFEFDFQQDQTFANLRFEFFVGDGTNTKAHIVVVDDAGVYEHHDIDINSMIEDGGTTDITAITAIGFRVADKRVGNMGYVDNLEATPPPGDIEIKLWDMGTNIPVSATTRIDDGTQYTKIGAAEAASYILALRGGKRLYHIEAFNAGMRENTPLNELLNIDNYYLIELKYVDTDVRVYGPDTSFITNYYPNGYAFTAPDEATSIIAIGEFSDLMFGILSTQDIYLTKVGWRFDGPPNGAADISVFAEDKNMMIAGIVIDHEHAPEQEFTSDLSLKPMFLQKGGKLEYYFNDDFTDSVSVLIGEMQFLCLPPVVNG